MDKSKQFRELIEYFESGKISSEIVMTEINKLSNTEVDPSWLCSNNLSIEIETFVHNLTFNWIFQDAITDLVELLKLLKTNTSIAL